MSTLNRAGPGRAGQPMEVSAPRLGVVTVAWAVSRDAAARVFKGVAEGSSEVELRWAIDLDRNASAVSLFDGHKEQRIATGGATAVFDEDLLHLQAAAGQDEFVATLRDEAVLYARTTLLERVGIGGGRYEVVRTATRAAGVCAAEC